MALFNRDFPLSVHPLPPRHHGGLVLVTLRWTKGWTKEETSQVSPCFQLAGCFFTSSIDRRTWNHPDTVFQRLAFHLSFYQQSASPSHWICSSASCNLSRLGCNRLLGKVGPIGCESQRCFFIVPSFAESVAWHRSGTACVDHPPKHGTLSGSVNSVSLVRYKNLQNRWLDQFHNMNFHWRMQPAQPRCSRNGSRLLSLSLVSWVQLMLKNATYLMIWYWYVITCVYNHAQPHLCAQPWSLLLCLKGSHQWFPALLRQGHHFLRNLSPTWRNVNKPWSCPNLVLNFAPDIDECRRHYPINCSVGSIEFVWPPSSGTHLGANRNALFRLAACLCWAPTHEQLEERQEHKSCREAWGCRK